MPKIVIKTLSIFIDTDNLVTLSGLTDSTTGEYINDATVSMTLEDSDGITVAADIPLTYTAESDGEYTGILANTVEMVAGDYYYLYVTATSEGAKLTTKTRMRAGYYS